MNYNVQLFSDHMCEEVRDKDYLPCTYKDAGGPLFMMERGSKIENDRFAFGCMLSNKYSSVKV